MLVFYDVAVCVLEFMLDAVLVEPLDGVDVVEALEGACRLLERGVELLDKCGRGRVFEEAIDDLADLEDQSQRLNNRTASSYSYSVFDVRHQFFEVNEGELGLQVRVFTQVTACMTRDLMSNEDMS